MPNPIDQKQATYTLVGGCSHCGAKRPRVFYSEYARYELVPPSNSEAAQSSGAPFVALVALEDGREETDTAEDAISCGECSSYLTNIEVTDWVPSREQKALHGLGALYRDMDLADPDSGHSGADQCAALYELLNSLGYPVA